MDTESLTLPPGIPVNIRNRRGWALVLPVGSEPPEFAIMGFYVDFARNVILQHEISKQRWVYAPPYWICRPRLGRPGWWFVEHVV